LKGVAEAIEHCTWTHVYCTVVTAIYALEMAASAKARLTFRIRLCRTSQMYGKLPRCDHGSLSTVSIITTTFKTHIVISSLTADSVLFLAEAEVDKDKACYLSSLHFPAI
jgi:hypothetical protein